MTPVEEIFDEAMIAVQRLPAEEHAHFLALVAPTIDFYVSITLTRDLANALGELPPSENETMGRWSFAVIAGDTLNQAALETWFITDVGISAETIEAARSIVAFAFNHHPPPVRERRIPAQPILNNRPGRPNNPERISTDEC